MSRRRHTPPGEAMRDVLDSLSARPMTVFELAEDTGREAYRLYPVIARCHAQRLVAPSGAERHGARGPLTRRWALTARGRALSTP